MYKLASDSVLGEGFAGLTHFPFLINCVLKLKCYAVSVDMQQLLQHMQLCILHCAQFTW